jgi:hypothetical protein
MDKIIKKEGEKGKMEKEMEKRCDNCVCWQRDGIDGICRANAPKPIIIQGEGTYNLVWPRTAPDEFCFDCFSPVK